MKFTKKMKRLLIFSAVLAFIGVVLCAAGIILSVKNDNELFSQTQNGAGQYVFEYEFDASQIKKISLDLSYADVNIYISNGAGKLEMVNYPLDVFGMTVGATTISVDEKSALGNLISFNFDGFRNYFNSIKMASKMRTVNVYLPSASALKLLDIELYSGDIKIEHQRLESDFAIDLEYGSVYMDDVISTGGFEINIAEGNLNISSSEISSGKAELKYGFAALSSSKVTDMEAEIARGYFKYGYSGDDLLSSVVRLKTDSGRVRFGSDIYENGSFSQGMEYTGASGVVQGKINVHVGEGNIMITE